MKTFQILSTLTLAVSVSVSANELTEFDLSCGKSQGLETVIKVRENGKEAFKPLNANYKGPSKDDTTGMALRGHSIDDFEGAPEVADGSKFYIFVSESSPRKQLYMERPTQIGQNIEAAHVIMDNLTSPYTQEFKCEVKKASK